MRSRPTIWHAAQMGPINLLTCNSRNQFGYHVSANPYDGIRYMAFCLTYITQQPPSTHCHGAHIVLVCSDRGLWSLASIYSIHSVYTFYLLSCLLLSILCVLLSAADQQSLFCSLSTNRSIRLLINLCRLASLDFQFDLSPLCFDRLVTPDCCSSILPKALSAIVATLVFGRLLFAVARCIIVVCVME